MTVSPLFVIALAVAGLVVPMDATRADDASLKSRNRIGLIIGINDYKHWPPLKNAVADARSVFKVLRSVFWPWAKARTRARNDQGASLAL